MVSKIVTDISRMMALAKNGQQKRDSYNLRSY